MKSTTDTYTGKRFDYNEVVVVNGIVVPARYTSRTATHLHPSRVPAKLLAQLNPEGRPDTMKEIADKLQLLSEGKGDLMISDFDSNDLERVLPHLVGMPEVADMVVDELEMRKM